jgi:hypothetical protein
LYEISSNVGPLQLQDIITDNIKIENENRLNVPSSSSSSFSDLDAFKKEGDDELPIAGYGADSETEGALESDIIPENPNALVQDNNNTSIARPKANFVPKAPSEQNLLRRAIENQITKFGSSVK